MDRSRLGPILHALVLALIAAIVVMHVVAVARLQWDFHVYLRAVRIALRGWDPYSLSSAAQGGRPLLPFVYPPITLAFFMPLALLPAKAAAAVWIALKAALLAGLIVTWWRFVPRAGLVTVAVLGVFGWNAAALRDLEAGNMAIVEAALLWGAFACYVAGRRGPFAALVVVAACFKLAPAAYLLLLLVPAGDRPPRPAMLAAALVALAALVAGPYLIPPVSGWEPFFAHLPRSAGLGDSNPSGLALFARGLVQVGTPGERAAWLASRL
jgi:hypothetical protein